MVVRATPPADGDASAPQPQNIICNEDLPEELKGRYSGPDGAMEEGRWMDLGRPQHCPVSTALLLARHLNLSTASAIHHIHHSRVTIALTGHTATKRVR